MSDEVSSIEVRIASLPRRLSSSLLAQLARRLHWYDVRELHCYDGYAGLPSFLVRNRLPSKYFKMKKTLAVCVALAFIALVLLSPGTDAKKRVSVLFWGV